MQKFANDLHLYFPEKFTGRVEKELEGSGARSSVYVTIPSNQIMTCRIDAGYVERLMKDGFFIHGYVNWVSEPGFSYAMRVHIPNHPPLITKDTWILPKLTERIVNIIEGDRRGSKYGEVAPMYLESNDNTVNVGPVFKTLFDHLDIQDPIPLVLRRTTKRKQKP